MRMQTSTRYSTSLIVNLINPPQPQLYDPSAYPSLGLLYLGAILEKEEFTCHYIDLSALEPYEKIRVPKADFHLITVMSATYQSSQRVMESIENGFKVAGGFHPSLFPEKSLKELGVDAVVVGEAENVISEVLLEKRKGVTYGDTIKNLDALPFPARHLIPLSKLRNLSNIHGDTYKNDGASTTLISSRGCPYRCAYCCKALPQMRYIRYRSAKNVVDELEEITSKFDIWHFRFVDDIFTVNRKRVHDLCALINQRQIEIYWLCITRTNTVTTDLLQTMYEAGCREIHFGIESGSQRLLELMNKQTTVETNLKAIEKAKKVGLKVKVFLMYDFPTETEEDIELTKKFVVKAQPDKWTLSKFTLLPGSDVYEHPQKYGIDLAKHSSEWYYCEENHPLKQWLRSEEWRR